EVLGEAPGQTQSQSQGSGAQSQGQSQSSGDHKVHGAVEHAHAFIGAARALAIPARYVSGYLHSDGGTEPGFHAWAEAWDDGLGWIGFDPLLGECPAERHVRLACGLDAETVPPVRAAPML